MGMTCSLKVCPEVFFTLCIALTRRVGGFAGETWSRVPDHGGIDFGAPFVGMCARNFLSTSLPADWRDVSSKW